MAYVIKRRDGSCEQIEAGATVALIGGGRVSYASLPRFSAAELASLDLYEVAEPQPPAGQRLVSVSYRLGADGRIEALPVFEALPQPPPPPHVIAAPAFIERFIDAEYAAIKRAARAEIDGGGARLQKWIDVAVSEGFVDLERPATAQCKAFLVAKGLLTQARADVIFSVAGA